MFELFMFMERMMAASPFLAIMTVLGAFLILMFAALAVTRLVEIVYAIILFSAILLSRKYAKTRWFERKARARWPT